MNENTKPAASAPPPRPEESAPCACRKAAPGMWTSGYTYDPPIPNERVRHGADECVVYVPKDRAPAPPPSTGDEPAVKYVEALRGAAKMVGALMSRLGMQSHTFTIAELRAAPYPGTRHDGPGGLTVTHLEPDDGEQIDLALCASIAAPAAPPSTGDEAPLRPEVLAFAQVMSAKIDGHNHDRGEHGWRTATPDLLLTWLDRYVASLREVIVNGCLPETIGGKAANVANLAMMIADVVGALATAPHPRCGAEHPGRRLTCGLSPGHTGDHGTNVRGEAVRWPLAIAAEATRPLTDEEAAASQLMEAGDVGLAPAVERYRAAPARAASPETPTSDEPLRAQPCCSRCKKAGFTECQCPIALPSPRGPVDPVCRWPVPMKQREWDNLRAWCDRIPDPMLAGEVRALVDMEATAWFEVATLRREVRRLRTPSRADKAARAVLDAAFEWYQCDVPGPDRDRAVRELSEAVQDWHAHGGARSPSRAEPDPGAWVIECTQSGTTDWSALFWAPDRCGYTTDLASAGRYTETEAKEQERSRPGVDIAHRLADVRALAKPRVDRDTLRRVCIERQRAAALPPPPGTPEVKP
jgi:hypothetical protein